MESFAIYAKKSGGLSYALSSSEPFIDGAYDDYFYKCVIAYSELQDFAKRKGFSTLASVIPHLTIEMWLDGPTSDEGQIVGLAIKNTATNEFAVQCF
ncbi:MAG: hypothetical protein ACKOX6_15260 [Bdellovibrio sp.]